MLKISDEIFTQRPAPPRSEQEERIYDRMEELSIPHLRLEHGDIMSGDDCIIIENRLGTHVCKNLFLSNRNKTEFYLLIMHADKPFKTKYLSAQLGCSRLSFADEEHMRELLRVSHGTVSALELIFDADKRVRPVFDREVMEDEYLAAHPGYPNCTLKLRREDMLRFISSTGHEILYVQLPWEETGEN